MEFISICLCMLWICMQVNAREDFHVTPCYLATRLRLTGFEEDNIGNLVCLAQAVSQFQYDLRRESAEITYYGLYQIRDQWCGSRVQGCKMECSDLLKRNITGSLVCLKRVFRIFGFSAWPTYGRLCPSEELNVSHAACSGSSELLELPDSDFISRCLVVDALVKSCFETINLGDWVCMADTATKMRFDVIVENHDGSKSHGLFHISDKYWCGNTSRGGECDVRCEDLRKRDIRPTVKCLKVIYTQQGFKAWPEYYKCRNSDIDISMCPVNIPLRCKNITDHCPVLQALYDANFTRSALYVWHCLLRMESKYQYDLVTRNSDGTRSYGLFQIHQRHCGKKESSCDIKCEQLITEDFMPSVKCAKQIYLETGYYGWKTYRHTCIRPKMYRHGCEIITTTTTTTTTTTKKPTSTTRGVTGSSEYYE